MKAGSLDRRITIRRAAISTDAMNSKVETWADLATVWASANYVSDGERAKSGQLNASRLVRFKIRYSSMASSVTPKDRIVFDGLTYDISGVKELERREGLEISAATRIDGG